MKKDIFTSVGRIISLIRWRTVQIWKRGLAVSKKTAFRRVVIAGVIASVTALFGMVMLYAHKPVVLGDVSKHQFNAPFTISFERSVNSTFSVRLREQVPGRWHIKSTITGTKQATFTPEKPFVPGTTVHAEFTGIRPLVDFMSKTPSVQVVQVHIEKAPAIAVQTPVASAAQVPIDIAPTVRLVAPNHGLRRLVLEGNIPVETTPVSKDDMTFTWPLTQPLTQGQQYEARLIDANLPKENDVIGTFTFTTVAEPQISEKHDGFIVPGSVITFDFDTDMAQTVDAIENGVPGNGQWKSTRQYTVTADAVKPSGRYSVVFKKGLRSVAGGVLTENKMYEFAAPGAVKVLAVSPSGSRAGLGSTISVTFDQAVNHQSAEAALSISPRVEGNFSWNGNTMQFRPNGLGYQTAYTVAIAPGVVPLFGQPGLGYEHTFTTIYETKKLPVPYYAQVHNLSCEAASLRMALAYYGVSTNDDAILAEIGYAPETRDTANNLWQDPYTMFVGNVDGVMNVDGWGVYAPPVAKAARAFGREATVLNNPTSAQVAAAVHSGNPVIVWGVFGSAPVDDSWNTTTSGVVHAAKNQHVRLVYGVDGTADNPIGFYIHDPIKRYGSLYWSAGTLQVNMNSGGKQALAVQ